MIVDELKKAILQYAIEGKITSRLKSDSDINVFFNAIRNNEKNDVEIKKIPFEIPNEWKWVSLGSVVSYQNGYPYNSNDMSNNKKGMPVIKSNNIMKLIVDLNHKTEYIENPTEKMLNSKTVKGDLLMCLSSQSANPEPLGKTAIYEFDMPALLNQRVLKMIPNDPRLTKYLYYMINSFYFHYNVSHKGGGSAQSNLKLEHVLEMPIPLPPIEEQQRIVEKIEELFNRLDELKNTEIKLNNLKNVFPNEMRKSILLCAISGNMNVNNSKEFVEGSIESTIADYAKPFEIPNNWKWYSHNDLFEVIGGSQPPKGSFSGTQKEGYIRLYQTRDYGEKPQPVYIKISDARKVTKKDDILLARYGGSLGKVFWAEEGAYNVAMVRVDIKYPEIINKKYLYYYYCADLYQKKIKSGNRSAQAGFSKEDLNDLCFPLPPIEEQQRIVEKLDYILPLIESL